MSGSDQYPKYQLPSGNWTTDKERADRLWARHVPTCKVCGGALEPTETPGEYVHRDGEPDHTPVLS